MNKPIQMELYTVAVYNLSMKEVNPGLNFFKGDN